MSFKRSRQLTCSQIVTSTSAGSPDRDLLGSATLTEEAIRQEVLMRHLCWRFGERGGRTAEEGRGKSTSADECMLTMEREGERRELINEEVQRGRDGGGAWEGARLHMCM